MMSKQKFVGTMRYLATIFLCCSRTCQNLLAVSTLLSDIFLLEFVFFFACKSRYVTVDPCARVNSVYLPTYLITRLQLACRSALVSDLRRPHFQLLENKTQKKASHATSDKLPFTFPTLKTEIEGLWTSTEARRRIVEF
jgi:hypothetical protein